MSDPYFVDHWFLWSNGELHSKKYDCADYKEALDRFDKCSAYPGTTRVVLRKRGLKRGSSSAMKVHENPNKV